MNRLVSSSPLRLCFFASLCFSACSVEQLRWPADVDSEDSGSSTGGAIWSVGGGSGGFVQATGGVPSGGFPGEGFRRGGFVGQRTAEVAIPGIDPGCTSSHLVSVYDEAGCRAGSLCGVPCAGPCGWAECASRPSGTNLCVVRCDVDADCAPLMICEETQLGRICLLSETPWTAECAPLFDATDGIGGAEP